jgi:hypothetical protein
MKRTLILLGALFLVSPALFAAVAPAATSPASPTTLQPATPAPLFLSSCQASTDCHCGSSIIPISCTGTISCTAGPASVTCDGHRYSCTMVDCNPQGPGGGA